MDCISKKTSSEKNNRENYSLGGAGLTAAPGIPQTEELKMLSELIGQEQFEPARPEMIRQMEAGEAHGSTGAHGSTAAYDSTAEEKNLSVIYLMNDAVESFLVFLNVSITGHFLPDYEGPLAAHIEEAPGSGHKYVMVLHQGENVVTFFFDGLRKEVHLYNYARLGHFWVKKYEYLRQLEYHIAILRDKRDYLGEEYCNEEELKLAYLTEFPPLNYCSYPASPEAYVIPAYPAWAVSPEALKVMEAYASEAGDDRFRKLLRIYRKISAVVPGKIPGKIPAKLLARQFHRVNHAALTDLLIRKMEEASSSYEDRKFGEAESTGETDRRGSIPGRAAARKAELERRGEKVTLVYEEPFTVSQDSVEYKIHLMIWKNHLGNRLTEVETIG